MKLQRTPNSWSCVATSAAMAFDMHVTDISKAVGHDGSEVIAPHLKPPMCYKGFHLQEMVDAAQLYGYSMMEVEALPVQTPNGNFQYDLTTWRRFEDNAERFEFYLNIGHGLLVGKVPKCWHCCAFDRGIIYDPRGQQYPWCDCEMMVKSLWIVTENQIIPRK